MSWWLLDSFWHPEPKTIDSYFVDMMYVEFMTNVLLADSSVVLAVRLILSSWAQKQVWFLLCRHACTWSSWKIFFLPIGASSWLLDPFWHPEPKNKWFLLCRHDVRRLHEKFSSRRFARDDWLLDSFWHPEPKNVWFQLSTHHVRRVHEKLSSPRFEWADGC